MRFPKHVRVRRRYEYLRFFNQSEVKRFDSCVVFRIPNTQEHARLGVTVKAKSGSVLRNKVKRQVRECFRQHRERLKSFDYNVVVSGNHPINYKTAKKVRKNLEAIWSHEVIF